MTAAFVFGIGLLIGSFLNVCIYRIPKNISIVKTPASHCPKCKKEIAWYDNVPLLSYLVLGGKCRKCGTKISLKYFIVEALTGVLFLAAYLKFGLTLEFLSAIILFSFLVVVALIDLKTQYIYDVTVVPLALIGLVFSFFVHGRTPVDSLIGFLTGGAFLLLIAYLSLAIMKKEGMGMGDVKLAAAVGFFLGWQHTIVMVFLSFFLGVFIFLPLLLLKKKGRKDYVPFGPFLALGTVMMVLIGSKLTGVLFPVME